MARSITSTIITAEAREMKLDGPKLHFLDLVQSESSDTPYHVQRCIRPNAATFINLSRNNRSFAIITLLARPTMVTTTGALRVGHLDCTCHANSRVTAIPKCDLILLLLKQHQARGVASNGPPRATQMIATATSWEYSR